MEEKILLIFKSTREVIICERDCKKAGFDCTAVPTPREHSTQCGIALEIPSEQKEKILELLSSNNKQFKYYNSKSLSVSSCFKKS